MLRFVKNSLLLLLLLHGTKIFAVDFNGIVQKNDNGDISNVYQAKIGVKEGNKAPVIYTSQADGSYKFSLNKNVTYQVIVVYSGFADTVFTFTTDKTAKPSAQNVIVTLKKDGINLFGSVRTIAEFIPIKDVVVVLKNVMTREERRINTGRDGTYKFRLEYENNYRLSVDKRSDGIFNKYRDTVLYISTISITQPMDYWLDLRLEEDNVKSTEGIEGYDPMQPNRTTKPGVDVKNRVYKAPTPNSMEYKGPTKAEAIHEPVPVNTKPDTAIQTKNTEIKKDSVIAAAPVIPVTPVRPTEQKPVETKKPKIDSTVVVTSVKPKGKQKPVKEKAAPVQTKSMKKDSLAAAASAKKAGKESYAKEKEMAKQQKTAREDSIALAEKTKRKDKAGKDKAGKDKPVQIKEVKKNSTAVVAKPTKKEKAKEKEVAKQEKAKQDSIALAEKANQKAKETKAKPSKERPVKKEIPAAPVKAKALPAQAVPTRTVVQVKADIEKAEKDLDIAKKKEVEVLKMAAFEKKQKEKNKGIEVVIIGENTKVTPEQVVAQRQEAEKKLKALEEELELVKKRKK